MHTQQWQVGPDHLLIMDLKSVRIPSFLYDEVTYSKYGSRNRWEILFRRQSSVSAIGLEYYHLSADTGHLIYGIELTNILDPYHFNFANFDCHSFNGWNSKLIKVTRWQPRFIVWNWFVKNKPKRAFQWENKKYKCFHCAMQIPHILCW